MEKAIFLDRDGTLNRDSGYVHKIEDFELLEGVIEGLKLLAQSYIFIIVTNQSGIGRGYYTIEDFHKFNEKLIETLKKEGIHIKEIYFCPHHPDVKCRCRKPHTENIEKAIKKFNIDIKNSWMIGDHPSDVALGTNAGCKTVFLLTGHGKKHINHLLKKKIEPTITADNFLSAAQQILDYQKL